MDLTIPNRMNPTDALFWLLDKLPDLRSTIGVLVVLERDPKYARVRSEVERLTQGLPRMRQRVAEVPLGMAPPEWVEDPQFDCDFHIRRLAVPAPGTMDELLDAMGPFYATAFDPDRPPWEAFVCEGLAGGRGALFIKMHHCLTDGVGAARLSGMLTRRMPKLPRPGRRRNVPPPSVTPLALLWRAAVYNIGDAVDLGRRVLRWSGSAMTAPAGMYGGVPVALGAAAGFAQELMLPRAQSPVRYQRSLSRRLATFELSLPEIEAVGKRVLATVNDVVLTLVSGAMHRWHAARGADVRHLRALVPVNLRQSGDLTPGNKLALLAVPLPVGDMGPLRRLRLIQQHMRRVKSDRRATLAPVLARVMSALPLALASRLGRQHVMRTNFACTNVPGPRRTSYFAGVAIERVFPFAPLVGDHPVAIAAYSYRDTLCVGLTIDPQGMDDPAGFRAMLGESYKEVLTLRGPRHATGLKRPARRR